MMLEFATGGGHLLDIAVWLQPNFAVEQTAGSHALAAAAHRGVGPTNRGGRRRRERPDSPALR